MHGWSLRPVGVRTPSLVSGRHCVRAPRGRPALSTSITSIASIASITSIASIASTGKPASISAAEKDVLQAISNVKGRGKDGMDDASAALLAEAVATLEASDAGVPDPTKSQLLEGKWRLLYTTRPSSASPIQRSFVGVDGFSVFQEVTLRNMPRVNNIVDFGPNVGFLKVEAAASTDQQPLANFTPRKGKGFFIFGSSSSVPPAKVNTRLDFQFDTAAFNLRFLPEGVTIPYPVPFRLLGDERKGWLDVTYLSKDGGFRLSRGNKGTLFVLKKEDRAKERLLRTLGQLKNRRSGTNQIDVQDLVDRVVEEEEGIRQPAKSPAARGGWKLLWSAQGSTANPLQQRLVGVVNNWQIISQDGARLQNRVQLLPGVRVIADATAEVASATRTRVVITDVLFELGPFKINLKINTDADGYVDWLYLDDSIRITRGNKGSVFVHARDPTVSID